MSSRPPSKWMTRTQAAERLGVEPEAVDRLVEDGRVEKGNNGSYRYRRTDIEAVAIVRTLRRKD